MEFLKKAWQWFKVSSVDPEKTALTLKAGMHTVFGIVLVLSPLFHVKFDQSQADQVVEIAGRAVVVIYAIASGVVTLLALVRKIVLTLSSK